jgi:hypothetical protein
VLTEEDLVETALLRYAQQRAAEWGADRFAAEFRRRDLEERWLEAARTNTTPHSPGASVSTVPTMLSGPVDASAQEHTVETEERDAWRLTRPTHARHSSVPRAPVEEEPEDGRGRLRRRKRQRAPKDIAWTISTAEMARMSPAARRLYGLEDPLTPDR